MTPRIFAFVLLTCAFSVSIKAQIFQHQYGTSDDNTFSKVLEDATGYYVLGSEELTPGGMRRATVTHLDPSGMWDWTTGVDIPSQWNDAVLTPTGDLIVVGHTLPYNSSNASLIGKIDINGGGWVNSYDEPGQETYNCIEFNTVPENSLFPYYILGKQIGGGPGDDDVVMLNLDEFGNFYWKSLIATLGDDEIDNDLEALPSGELLIAGGTPGVWGLILRVHNTGVVYSGLTPAGELIEYEDIAQTSTGDVYAVANSTVGSDTYLFKYDNANLFPVWQYKLTGLTAVHQVWEASPGDFYVTGSGIFNSMTRTVLMRFTDGPSINFQWLKFLDDGEVAYDGGWTTSLSSNRIGFVDGRTPASGGLGILDAFMSASDLSLTTCMTDSDVVNESPIGFLYNSPDFGPPVFDTLPFGSPVLDDPLLWSQLDVCSLDSCFAGFLYQVIDDCGTVHLINSSWSTSGAITTCWDFDGNLSTCESVLGKLVWQFPGPPCQTLNVCLIMTVSNGCKDTVCQSITIFDNISPAITCPPDLTLSCDDDVSPLTTGFATAIDNCIPPPTITYADIIFGNIPCSGFIERTWTATDDCGNSSTCFQIIFIDDNIPPVITNCPTNMTFTFTGVPSPCTQYIPLPIPIVTDLCDPNVTWINDYNGGPDASDFYPNGPTLVTFTATDACGNTATCSFTVTITCDPPQPQSPFCGMTTVTCFSGYNFPNNPSSGLKANGNVLAIIDPRALTNTVANGMDASSVVPMIKDPQWVQSRMGQLFGIAIDDNDQIYVAASTIYGKFTDITTGADVTFGTTGSGGIYRIDPVTGNVTDFVYTSSSPGIGSNTIYNTGSGLGNICFDKLNRQFFVTNFTDGKIYRIDMNGIVQSVYDHPGSQTFPPTDATFIPLGDRPFGIQMHPSNGRLYYAVWREDYGRQSASQTNEIWSIAIDPATKDFLGAATCEIEIASYLSYIYSNAPSDLSFSNSGKLLVGERTIDRDYPAAVGIPAHLARVLEYTPGAPIGSNCNPIWGSPKLIYVGNYKYIDNTNCAGGVDYGYNGYDFTQNKPLGCDELVWSTGDALKFGTAQNYYIGDSETVYGLAGMPAGGNANVIGASLPYVKTSSYYIDLGPGFKTEFGDVELFECVCADNALVLPCDSLYVYDSIWAQGNCCYSIDFDFQVGPVSYVQAQSITPGVTFNGAVINAPFTWHSTNNGVTILAFEHNTSPSIPVGTYLNPLNFCLGNITSSTPQPQQVVFSWYAIGTNGTEYVACRDTLNFNCPPPVPVDTCAAVVSDTVYCLPTNPYEYCLDFTVQNTSTNLAFTANQVLLSGITPGFSFRPCPPPVIPFTSSSISLNLTPPISPTQISSPLCVKIVSLTPILSPTVICMDLALSSSDTCCHASIPFCITLEPCCSPCGDRDVIVHTPTQDSCCHSLDITNDCAYNYFTGLQIQLLTSGVNFGSHFTGGPNPGDWNNSFSSTSLIEWNHISGFIPQGTIAGLINFCLDDIDMSNEIPQTVVLNWLTTGSNTTDSVACRDTLIFNCPSTEYGCITALDDTVKCAKDINGNTYYEYELTFQNTSAPPHTATHFNFQQIGGPPAVVFPNPIALSPILGPSGVQTINTNIFPNPTLNPGDKLTFLVRLADFLNPDDWCCHEADTLCIVIPQCDSCVCLGFDDVSLYWGNGFVGWQITLPCGNIGPDTLPCIPTGELYRFKGDLLCSDSCTASVEYDLISLATNTSIGSGPVPTVPIGNNTSQFDFTAGFNPPPGGYQLALTGHCGSDSCICLIDFFVPACDTCFCGDYTDISADWGGVLLETADCGDTLNVPAGLPLTLDASFLCHGDECDTATVVCWDLIGPLGLVLTGCEVAMPNFSILIPDAVFVNGPIGIYELNLESFCGFDSCVCTIYFNVTFCGSIIQFEEDVDQAVDVISDNTDCSATVHIGALPDNIYIDHIAWGDGGINIGPIHANGTVSHFYADDGEYEITYVAIGLDDTGEVCFGRAFSNPIDVECLWVCCPGPTNMVFSPVLGGGIQQVNCNDLVAISCLPGATYTLTGMFSCTAICPVTPQISWQLIGPDGLPIASNTITSTPFFGISLPSSYFYQIGLYELHVTGLCGNSFCPCIIYIEVPIPCPNPCPCDPLQFMQDVNKGFLQIVNLSNPCQRCFKPLGLTKCDTVQWYIGTTPVGTPTIGNQWFCYTFPVSGTYTISMVVTRKKGISQFCEVEDYSKTISVNCGFVPYPNCWTPKVYNVGFDSLSVPGILGADGTTANWVTVSGTPRIDTSQNTLDGWFVELAGNADVFDAIRTEEEICLDEDSMSVNLLLRSLEYRPGEQLVVRLIRDGLDFLPDSCLGDQDCFEIFRLELPETSGEWFTLEQGYRLSSNVMNEDCEPQPGRLYRPVIYVTNSLREVQGPDVDSHVQIDNFCLELHSTVGVEATYSTKALRVYPNPNNGDFSVDLSDLGSGGDALRIISLTGQLMSETQINAQAIQDIHANDLTEGMYFLQVLFNGQQIAVGKFVKQ